MNKWIVIVLIALWACLIVTAGINAWNQYQLYRLQSRMLEDYKQYSQTPEFLKAVQDSLLRDAMQTDSLRTKAGKSFPFKDAETNWLALRLSVVGLTLLTVLAFWIHLRKKQE